MAKRFGFHPSIILSSTPGDDVVIGSGSGQSGIVLMDPVPCSYEYWLASEWAEDFIQGDGINEYDFGVWWESCGFSEAEWEEMNPRLDYEEYVG